MTVSFFFSSRNNDRAPARQTTVSFFPVVIKLSRHNKKTAYFPPEPKTDTTAQPVRNTKNYFPPEPKKITQHHNCMLLQVHSSMYNQNLFPAKPKTDTTAQLEKRFLQPTRRVGRFLQPTQSECIRFSVSQSVRL